MKIFKKIIWTYTKALLLYALVYLLVSETVKRIEFFTELVSHISANVVFVFSGTAVLSFAIFCLFFVLSYFATPYRQNLLNFIGVSWLAIIVFSAPMIIITSIYEVSISKCTDMLCGLGTYYLWRFLVVAIIMAWFLNFFHTIAWRVVHNKRRTLFKSFETKN